MLSDRLKNILLILMAMLNIILIGLWWINRSAENKITTEKTPVSAPSKDDIVKLVTDKLHFDSSQQLKFTTELSRHFAWMNNYHVKENTDRKMLMENFTFQKPDSLLGIRYSDSLAILRIQMGSEMFRHFNFIRNLCKPDQLPYFQSFMHNLADSTNHFENHTPGKSSFIIKENKRTLHLSCIEPYYLNIN
jgi:hypothetical protein